MIFLFSVFLILFPLFIYGVVYHLYRHKHTIKDNDSDNKVEKFFRSKTAEIIFYIISSILIIGVIYFIRRFYNKNSKIFSYLESYSGYQQHISTAKSNFLYAILLFFIGVGFSIGSSYCLSKKQDIYEEKNKLYNILYIIFASFSSIFILFSVICLYKYANEMGTIKNLLESKMSPGKIAIY